MKRKLHVSKASNDLAPRACAYQAGCPTILVKHDQ